MKHIFVNDFSKQFFVYEEDVLVDKGTFEDSLFLSQYTNFDLCYISNSTRGLPQYDEYLLNDWGNRFLKSISRAATCKLWFLGKDMQFHLLESVGSSQSGCNSVNIPQVCIGGGFDGCDMHFSMEDFCSRIIELYKPAHKEEQSINISDEIAELKGFAKSLSENMEEIKQALDTHGGDVIDETIKSLKNELTAYRTDFYLKSVQRLGLDAFLDVLDRLCTRLYNSSQSSEDSKETLRYAISMIERTLHSKFHIRCVSSESGTVFNSRTMIAYPEDSVFTDNVSLKGCVAHSISPAIYWTLPRVNSDDTEFLYKEENVVLYQD